MKSSRLDDAGVISGHCLTLVSVHQVSAGVVSAGATGGVVISPSPSPSCLSAASSIDNLTTPLADITAGGGAAGAADGASGSDRKEGEGVWMCLCMGGVCVCVVGGFCVMGDAECEMGGDITNRVCLCSLASAAGHDHQPVPEERRAGAPEGDLPSRAGVCVCVCVSGGRVGDTPKKSH